MSEPAADTVAPPVRASLKKMLRGSIPVFLVHKSYQNSKRLNEVFDELALSHGKTLGVGTVVPMQNHIRSKVEEFMTSHSDVPLRIADLELHSLPGSTWEGVGAVRKPNSQKWTGITEVPEKVDRGWVRGMLDLQRAVGATVLLSATGWLDHADATKSVDNIMGFVRESRDVAGDEHMMVNLAMDYRWLVDSDLRRRLLDEIVESNEKAWYLRFWWPEIPVRYGQLSDAATLAGFKELATTCAVEGKRLFLPNSGLTGWVMSALGATGFSTGTSWGEQAFARQRIIAGRKGVTPPPAIPRYFDSTLMHTVEYNEYLRLREFKNHKDFTSSFSQEIEDGAHSPELAGLHYLMAAANMQAGLNAPRPNIRALKAVKRSSEFVDELRRADRPAALNKPVHLDEWAAVLR